MHDSKEFLMKAFVKLDVCRLAGAIDRRIFSGFLEHIGRAVYGGVYEPGNSLSDAEGFRGDVLDALKGMDMALVRYPGGNFVSNYDWRDGIGPQAQRPARPDFAWKTIEPNTFGVDEFMAWSKRLEVDPIMVVNLGTADAREAAALLEYCNLPGRTYWSDQRVANGNKEPYAVKTWGLGNEMDGPWQAGHVPAEVYANRALQAGQLMKGLDPAIELIVTGSTASVMPTYLEWDRVILERCWDTVDYISCHRYSHNRDNNSQQFLAEGVVIDQVLEDYGAVIRYVRARKKSRKQVCVAFDEWNVWYRKHDEDYAWWQFAPPLLEEMYNLEDALVVAQYLNSFIRHADLVKIACVAQIVNVIAPILTRPDGILLQSIYYPLALYSAHARGLSLDPVVECPTYEAGELGSVPVLDASASYDAGSGEAAVFLVNRSQEQDAIVNVALTGRELKGVTSVLLLSGDDPKVENSWDNPGVIAPVPGEARMLGSDMVQLRVPALGLAVVCLQLHG